MKVAAFQTSGKTTQNQAKTPQTQISIKPADYMQLLPSLLVFLCDVVGELNWGVTGEKRDLTTENQKVMS